MKRYQPEKDATDTAIGMELAFKAGSDRFFFWALREKVRPLYGKPENFDYGFQAELSGMDSG